VLSDLAFESKSYWKYDEEYLVAAREYIKISASEIECDHVYLYEDDHEILGFYHFTCRQETSELIWFFIHPSSIGKGIGKILWTHLLSITKELEIKEFLIKSDQNAEAFYIKQGAKRIGLKPSTVNADIQLPLLTYITNHM